MENTAMIVLRGVGEDAHTVRESAHGFTGAPEYHEFMTQRTQSGQSSEGPHKAYEDLDFLNSADARVIRVIAELLEPHYRLQRHGIEDTIVFFGSARIPATEEDHAHAGLRELSRYYADARVLARRLTEWNQRHDGDREFVVCSGGGPGIMEAVNRGAEDAGGKSIGFGISLPDEQAINPYVTPDLAFEFHYFFVRKFWFVYNAKALVFFPGGFGTLDELMEVLTLVQTRKMRKRLGIVLYGSEFWRSVLDFDALVAHGVISPEDREELVFADSVDEAFTSVCSFLEQNYGASLLEEQ